MARSMVSALILVAAATPLARAGTMVSSGVTSLWGNTTPYQVWDILQDPTIYIGVESVEGRSTDMAFHNGRLYVAHPGLLMDAGPMFYTPGPDGNLTAPTTYRVQLSSSDPRRWTHGRFLAINDSGSGFGAFAGPNATLAMIGHDQGSGTRTYSLTPSGGDDATMSPVGEGPAFVSVLEYISSTDRFAYSVTDPNPAISDIYFATHNASGLTSSQKAFTIPLSGVYGIDAISGSFASSLLQQTVTQDQVLLVLSSNLIGASTPAQLAIYTLTGQQHGPITDLPILPFDATFARGLAVDEANGNIYIGEKLNGQIITLHIPTPATTIALPLLLALTTPRRRRCH